MQHNTRCICVLLVLQLIFALLVLPVSGITNGTAAGSPAKPTISATLSAAYITPGQPIKVMGIATGTVTQGVQVWVFAGNYVNVSIVPVNPSGTFSATYTTTGLPPAKYYVIVQHPGSDNSLQIMTSGYAGQVINRKTNATIFNFTGTGSVHDEAAVTALSDAFNEPGVDDIYTKAVFTILPANETVPTYPGTIVPGLDSHGCNITAGYTWCGEKQTCIRTSEETCSAASATQNVTPAATTRKSPVEIVTVLAGIVIALGAALYGRKQ